jgi:hypothetical protein
MFSAKFLDLTVGFVQTKKFKSLRFLLNHAEKSGITDIWVNQDNKYKHRCVQNSKKEWFIYKTTKMED